MKNINILDCTLREGGYVNNWDFGYENIRNIITNLTLAGVEYIEGGFLKQENHSQDMSIFSNIYEFTELISKENSDTIYTLMINYGEYNISLLPDCPEKNIGIRIAFKKDEQESVCRACGVEYKESEMAYAAREDEKRLPPAMNPVTLVTDWF